MVAFLPAKPPADLLNLMQLPTEVRDYQKEGDFPTSPQHSLSSSSFGNNSITLESSKVGYAHVLTINQKNC